MNEILKYLMEDIAGKRLDIFSARIVRQFKKTVHPVSELSFVSLSS